MNYIALRLMLADAPRYVKKSGNNGRGNRRKGGTLSGYFQSRLKANKPK